MVVVNVTMSLRMVTYLVIFIDLPKLVHPKLDELALDLRHVHITWYIYHVTRYSGRSSICCSLHISDTTWCFRKVFSILDSSVKVIDNIMSRYAPFAQPAFATGRATLSQSAFCCVTSEENCDWLSDIWIGIYLPCRSVTWRGWGTVT